MTAKAETTENRGNMGNTVVQPATESMEADNWEMVVDLIQTAFREGRGTGTATLEAKLLQQIAALR